MPWGGPGGTQAESNRGQLQQDSGWRRGPEELGKRGAVVGGEGGKQTGGGKGKEGYPEMRSKAGVPFGSLLY